VILSGWSAGYGAIRQILSAAGNYARINAVLLMDGIHAGYLPDGTTMADGGRIDSSDIESFYHLAQDATRKVSKKKFLITHSEVFPATFASSTECVDYLLEKMAIRRTAVLQWGPGGMQQLSTAGREGFLVLGFAGNSAPDHVDHLHGLRFFLRVLESL